MLSIIDEAYEITSSNLVVSLISNARINLVLAEGLHENEHYVAIFDGKEFYGVNPADVEKLLCSEKNISQKMWELEYKKIDFNIVNSFLACKQQMDIHDYLLRAKTADYGSVLTCLGVPFYPTEANVSIAQSQSAILGPQGHGIQMLSSGYGPSVFSGVFDYQDASGLAKDEVNLGLLRAAETGNVSLIQRYLKMGADIDATENKSYLQKETPLMLAVRRGHFLAVKFLIENGAESKQKTRLLLGKTAKDLAKEMKGISEVHSFIYYYLKGVELRDITKITNSLSAKKKDDVYIFQLVNAINQNISQLNTCQVDRSSIVLNEINQKIKFLYAYAYKEDSKEFIRDNIYPITFDFLLTVKPQSLNNDDSEYLASMLFDVYFYDKKKNGEPNLLLTNALNTVGIFSAALSLSAWVYSFMKSSWWQMQNIPSQAFSEQAITIAGSVFSILCLAVACRYDSDPKQLQSEEKNAEVFRTRISEEISGDIIERYLTALNQWEKVPPSPPSNQIPLNKISP